METGNTSKQNTLYIIPRPLPSYKAVTDHQQHLESIPFFEKRFFFKPKTLP
jgi:hypothetical protein